MADAYRLLAEEDGACFHQTAETGCWSAQDRDGTAIVPSESGAISIAEAARLYCEDKGLATPEEILDRIFATYRPYHVIEEFWQGFRACRHDSVVLRNPCPDGSVKATAWDRGAKVARQYQQVLAQRVTAQAETDEVEPAWLVKLLRTGRR